MKTYKIYFSDYPTQALTVTANNKTDARKIGRLYNRQWQLKSSIIKIEEVKAGENA